MKIYLKIFLSSLLVLVSPVFALAAFNDVSLSPDSAIISISSVNLTVQGGNGASVEKIVVNADSFVPTLPANSYFKVKSTNRRKFTIDPVGSLKITTTCNDTESTLELDNPSTGSSVAPSVGVSSDSCAAGGGGGSSGGGGGSSGGSSGGGSSGGGGGGGGTAALPAVARAAAVVAPVVAQPLPTAVGTVSTVFNSDLSRGSQGNDVSRLQELLKKDSSIYPEGIVNGTFGPATEKAVKRFQAKYGISQLGRVGPATRAKLQEVFGAAVPVPAPVIPAPVVAQPSPVAMAVSPVFNSDLQKGARNDDVKRLQELLAKDSSIYPDGTTSGFYGTLTEQAVKKFQAKYGLPQAGRVGPATRAKLQEVFQIMPAPAPAPAPVPVNPVQPVIPPATTAVPSPPPPESVPFWMQLKPSPRAGGASVVDPSSASSPESPQTVEQKKAYAEQLPFWMQLTQ